MAARGQGIEACRLDAAGSRTAPAAWPSKFLADLRRGGKARLHGWRARHGARTALFRRRSLRSVHRGAHVVSLLRPDVAVYQYDVSRRVRQISQVARGLHGSGLQLGALLDGTDERRVGEAGRSRSAKLPQKTERIFPGRTDLSACRRL